jgi:bacterioferritin-associated ferredoxin
MTPPAAPFAATLDEVSAKPRYLCHCLKVTADQVQDAVAFHGCESVAEVTGVCGAGGGCTACHRRIRAALNGR